MKLLSIVLLYFLLIFQPQMLETNKQSCSSPIYCQGELLRLVQTSGIFNDSKTFVDMSLVYDQNQTLTNFDMFMRQVDQNPTKKQIQEFVSKHFKTVGEMDDFQPDDYNPEPRFIKEVPDKNIRKFLTALVNLWPQLTRKISHHVMEKPETYSLIPVKNAFIIPGGRFKEYYYWDSYWIVKGLLLSDMKDTAKGVIENLLSMVERYGFVPNGGRIYYLNRSQPPVLTLMMTDYVHYTRDFEFLREHIKTLEKELDFWLKKRTKKVEKDGVVYTLAHFDSESDTPRPESYLEDIITCSEHRTEDERHECYSELKSGAESGWDFTARWLFDKNGEPSGLLSNIKTRRNIPVDLNSFLFRSFMDMSKFYAILREPQQAKYWFDLAENWRNSIEKVFYDEEDGMWYDYDNKLHKHRKYFSTSNFTPLWVSAVDPNDKADRGRRAAQYLKKHGMLGYHGIPSTTIQSGQQWDYPNAWSPYQNIIILGLQNSGDEEAQDLARELANKWVKSNIKAFDENKVMFEKYNAKNSGQFGGGGEYHIQSGFGWSNGSIMELIDVYFRTKSRKSRSLAVY